MVVFEKCDRTVRTCKTDTDIKKWMESKYIIHAENIKVFIQHGFEEERIEQSSVMVWHPLSPDVRTDTIYIVQRKSVIMNDYRFNVGSLLHDDEIGFETIQAPSRIMPYKNQFQNAVTFEMSLSQIEYKRRVYNFLDFLSDLGGLFGTLGPFCALIVAAF